MYKSKHYNFITTPIFNILEESVIACRDIGDGIETQTISEYILQTTFLKMTGASEQKLKCICWELATNDYEYRYQYLNKDYVECSKYKDKNAIYKDLIEEIRKLEDEKYKFYNVLHFSYGDEIEYFLKSEFINKKPIHIKVYINDPYIENNHIKKEQLPLHGAYLDETINPLSALKRIYKKDIFFKKTTKFMYEGDSYDYASISQFQMDNIEIETFVKWNDKGNREKYIDIYFEEETIRLDSFNKSVINLTTKEVLYKNDEERMYKHYLNAFKDFETNNNNKTDSLKLNYQILRGA